MVKMCDFLTFPVSWDPYPQGKCGWFICPTEAAWKMLFDLNCCSRLHSSRLWSLLILCTSWQRVMFFFSLRRRLASFVSWGDLLRDGGIILSSSIVALLRISWNLPESKDLATARTIWMNTTGPSFSLWPWLLRRIHIVVAPDTTCVVHVLLWFISTLPLALITRHPSDLASSFEIMLSIPNLSLFIDLEWIFSQGNPWDIISTDTRRIWETVDCFRAFLSTMSSLVSSWGSHSEP